MQIVADGANPSNQQERSIDIRLQQAREFVEKSDKYMLHTKLRRGMKGYGLTVITGTKIEKFNVTVLSVLHNFAPSRDIILCKLSGLGLEKSGIIAGMSGSPVYIKEHADGKYKLIGTVAFG